MFGFPRKKWPVQHKPDFQGNITGATSGSAYHSWKLRIMFKQSVLWGSLILYFARANTFWPYILDDSDNVVRSLPPIVKTDTVAEPRLFTFRPLWVQPGSYYRILVLITNTTTAERIYYTSTFYNGTTHQEIQSWLNGANNNAHIVMQVGMAQRGRYRVEYRL